MSNQNLNTLNVETLNFTGPTIYQRGRPWFPQNSPYLCCTYLGVGLTVDCPPTNYPPSLQVTENAKIHDTLFISPAQGSCGGLQLKSLCNPLFGPPSNRGVYTITFTNDFTTDVSGFTLGYNGDRDISQNMISDTFNIFSLSLTLPMFEIIVGINKLKSLNGSPIDCGFPFLNILAPGLKYFKSSKSKSKYFLAAG